MLVNAYDASLDNKVVDRWLKGGKLKYINNELSLGLRRYPGLQLSGIKSYLAQSLQSRNEAANINVKQSVPKSASGKPYAEKIIYQHEDLVNYREEKIKQSVNNNAENGRLSVEEAISLLPKWIKKLIESRNVQVVQSVSDLPRHLFKRGTALYHAAWHGSPYNHDKFDSAKIGTGEGAQAFGFGHYFSDLQEVGEWYRDSLTKRNNNRIETLSRKALRDFKGTTSLEDDFAAALLSIIDYAKLGLTVEQVNDRAEEDGISHILSNPLFAKYVGGKWEDIGFKKGKLYQVELAPEEDEYLDWHKPLGGQSEKVSALLGNMPFISENVSKKLLDGSHGEEIYTALVNAHQLGKLDGGLGGGYIRESQQAASDYLHKLGIRGIRYPVENGKADGYNYVIFSDEDISITAKYSEGLDGVEALYDPKTDTTYLVADMLDKDTIKPIIHHELFHRALATDKRLQASVESFKDSIAQRFKWASQGKGSDIEIAAYKRVIAAETKPEHQQEEFLAYMVTEYNNSPDSFKGTLKKLFDDLVAAIRVAMYRMGVPLKDLNPAILSALARQVGAKPSNQNMPDGVASLLSKSAIKSVEANINRGKKAMTKALLEKTSVHRAMFRQGLGWVDFNWGWEGGKVTKKGRRPGAMGIEHILEARQRKDGLTAIQAETLLFDLVETIAKGEEIAFNEFNGVIRATINDGKNEVLLIKRPSSNSWLLSGYIFNEPDGTKAGGDAYVPTYSESTPARNGMGAGEIKITQPAKNSSNPSENPMDKMLEAMLKQYAGKDSAPTEAELKEAVRQYRAIEARYFNTDYPEGHKGSEKPGAMLAPNGERTKLNKVQWIQVRTRNFQDWFEIGGISNLGMRQAETVEEAKKLAIALQGKVLTNRDGMVAIISGNNLGKMLNDKAANKSESVAEHIFAVANIGYLFERSRLGWSRTNNQDNKDLEAIHRVFVPMRFGNKARMVKMTVKKFIDPNQHDIIYSVESIPLNRWKWIS